jgi:hypothetical protein
MHVYIPRLAQAAWVHGKVRKKEQKKRANEMNCILNIGVLSCIESKRVYLAKTLVYSDFKF